METHLKFNSGLQKKFLIDIKKKSNLTINQLSKISNISSRQFSDWRREKNCISLVAAKKMSTLFKIPFPESEKFAILKWRRLKISNAKIGGNILIRKHGSPGTLEGRKKGGRNAIIVLRKNGTIPSPKFFNLPKRYSSKLAELIGILLGDGGITSLQVHITLNREADSDYIYYVKSLCLALFNEVPKTMERKDSKATVLYYSGVNLVHYLESIGLKRGNKVKLQVGVPSWINTQKKYQLACLRGLMDTDGGVFTHKYKVSGKTYVYTKASFTNRSLPLLSFVFGILKNLGLSPKIIDKVENKKVWLYNQNEVLKYLEVVGSSNFRLLKYK